MKWAVFEFEDLSCDVGQTAWIHGEDESLFNDNDWFSSKEIIVKWPNDCAKFRRISAKTQMDIDEVDTVRYSAKIIKFSDDFEMINEYLKEYLRTGTTKTPTRGRGHRVSRKNPLFENSSDDEKENSPEKRKAKKPRKEKVGRNPMLNVLKKKYNISAETISPKQPLPSKTTMGILEYEIHILKESNASLKKEVEQLHLVVDSLKDLPSIIKSLEETIQRFKKASDVKASQQPTSFLTEKVNLLPTSSKLAPARTPTASPARSPLSRLSPAEPRLVVTSPCIGQGISRHDKSTIEVCPGIQLLPAQKKLLDSIGDAKSYAYTIMEMIWSRDVLATHSLTGKVSNAHKDKVAKPCLDQVKVTALCELIKKRFDDATDKDIKNFFKAKLNNIEKCHKLKKINS